MTTPTASERALLDTHPQQTDLYLSIYEPTVAVACRVTGSYDHNNQSVATYDVTEGALGNITEWLYNITLVGTSAGSDDKGRTWTRYASGTSIRFLESDHINWANGDYLTVLKFTEIIPVFPRIIQNPAVEDDVIFYKVWDVPYTNQNSILGSFINMGCNHAEFRDVATGLASVYWSASGTANLLGDALTYLWEFEGGTPTGSTSATPGWVTYNTPGHYRTILRVNSASNREDISARYVSVYDRPGYGSNVPILNWEIVELSGSRDSIGTKGRLRVRTDVSKPEIKDGALVVIFKDDWYGATKQSIGGNASNRSSIHFWGYIQDGTIQYNYQDGFVEFEVLSPAHIMEISECFSCSVESKASPSKWYELLNMTVGRAIYHYLAWQSSVLQCCDVLFPRMADDDRNIQYFDADRTSLYEAINGVVSGALKGRVVCDRQGKLYIEKEFSVLDSPTAKLPIAMDIFKKDWIGQLTVTEQVFSPTAFIEMGGIAYSGSTGTFGAFLASAPGSAPRYQGSVERIQGLALNSQADLNTTVGHLLANMNARYPRIEMVMRCNLANLDIAPQELVRLTVLPEDTPRGITFTLKEFALRSVDWSWNAKDKLLVPRSGISEVTQGFAGTTITIPNVPPTEGDDDSGGGYTVPPIIVPPVPPPANYFVWLYDEGINKGSVNILDFMGDPVVASATGTHGFIQINCCDGYETYGTYAAAISFVMFGAGGNATPNSAKVSGYTIITDEGNWFSNGNVTITVPVTGLYKVTVRARSVNFGWCQATGASPGPLQQRLSGVITGYCTSDGVTYPTVGSPTWRDLVIPSMSCTQQNRSLSAGGTHTVVYEMMGYVVALATCADDMIIGSSIVDVIVDSQF